MTSSNSDSRSIRSQFDLPTSLTHALFFIFIPRFGRRMRLPIFSLSRCHRIDSPEARLHSFDMERFGGPMAAAITPRSPGSRPSSFPMAGSAPSPFPKWIFTPPMFQMMTSNLFITISKADVPYSVFPMFNDPRLPTPFPKENFPCLPTLMKKYPRPGTAPQWPRPRLPARSLPPDGCAERIQLTKTDRLAPNRSLALAAHATVRTNTLLADMTMAD